LIKSDQIEKADALALKWLKDAQVPGELAPAVDARLYAAIYLMLGNGYQLYINRVEERWLAPLAQAALYFARHEERASAAGQILSNYQFQRSEEARRLRKSLAAVLTAEVGKLSADQVGGFSDWVQSEDLEPAAWTKVADVLRQRWTSEVKEDVKHR